MRARWWWVLGAVVGLVSPGWAQFSSTIQYAEDTVHTSGHLGNLALGVQKLADGALSGDGDYTPFQFDENGFLKVNMKAGGITGTVTVKGAGAVIAESIAVRCLNLAGSAFESCAGAGGAGGTSIADDAAFAAGTSLTPVGGVYRAIVDPVNDGDAGAFAMTINRALHTTPVSPTGASLVDDTNDSVRVTGTTVFTHQGRTQTTKEWHFTAAETNTSLVLTANKVRVSHAHFTCANANTADVGVRVGLAAATLPAVTTTSTGNNAGAANIILSHPGVAPGSGVVTSRPGVVEGAAGDDLRITMSVPTGGSCRLVADYEEIS